LNRAFYESKYKSLSESNTLIYGPAPSLANFLENEIRHCQKINWNRPLSILEIGSGAGSQFNETYKEHDITAIDFSKSAISHAKKNNLLNINYQNLDITQASSLPDKSFDLAFDSHCLHCLTEEEQRRGYFEHVHRVLTQGGALSIEAMVYHSKMIFDDQFTYKDNILKDNDKALRYIPRSHELEAEVLSYGFEICYLRVFSGLKMIPTASRDEALATDPDLLRMIATKK
jgi:ubiquinone/menaquinone biosynthesis C-methylase UbiE